MLTTFCREFSISPSQVNLAGRSSRAIEQFNYHIFVFLREKKTIFLIKFFCTLYEKSKCSFFTTCHRENWTKFGFLLYWTVYVPRRTWVRGRVGFFFLVESTSLRWQMVTMMNVVLWVWLYQRLNWWDWNDAVTKALWCNTTSPFSEFVSALKRPDLLYTIKYDINIKN